MPRRSRPSGRPSTTSPRTSKSLRELIAGLPPERAAAVFTHSSWAADRTASYERLEFLGDSVLELAIARTLYDRFPGFSEGRLAKVRSHVVSRASCAVVSRELGLGERLLREGGTGTDDAGRLAREPQRARGGPRGGARGGVPRARLRGGRARGRRGVRAADRVRADELRRPQDGAAGAACARRAIRLLRDARRSKGRRTTGRSRRPRSSTRRSSARASAARRRTPSRRRPRRCSRRL